MKFNRFYGLIKWTIPLIIISLSVFSEVFAQTIDHTIKSGETLSSIAKKYKTTIENLYKLNPDAKAGIRAGGVLKVSEGTKEVRIAVKKPDSEINETSGKHLVLAGESFYKIAKKYKVSISDLEKWNGFGNSGLKSGSEIYIKEPQEIEKPAEKQTIAGNAPKEEKEEKKEIASDVVTHKIVKGETLSTIATKYGITVAELKSLNNLKNNQINLGQSIKVSGTASSNSIVKVEPEKPKKQEEPIKQIQEPEKITKVEPIESKPEPIKIAQPVIPNPASQEPDKEIVDTRANTGSIREVNNSLGYTRVVETGFAEAIEGDVNSKKHLCLHKTAPTGSILQVKNEANGQSVFVKVIGKLPETGSNEKLIIRISRQAYDRLLAVGKRFAVEVSYPESQ